MIFILLTFALVALASPALARFVGPRVFWILALIPAAAFAYTLVQTPQILAGKVVAESIPWIPSLGISLSFRMDALSYLLALIVTSVGALVLVYCAKYFRDDERGLGNFAAYLFLFAGVMFGLVTSDDVLVLVVFWELTSVLSFLLIGHYSRKRESRGAASQALVITSLGGLAMLVGVIILSVGAGTTSLSEIIANPPEGAAISVAIVLVLVGAFSKSALFPFHFWLPAAMAAPTPVSAYLHAAAMVKAGLFLVARLAPGFSDLPVWVPLIVLFGGWTMLLGGWRSLRQNDLKLILAHGTVSQLGFITIAIGLGTPELALAGMAVLTAHALFKSVLFLVVGIIDHDAHTRDIRQLSGIGKKRPWLLAISIISAGSMVGLPLTLGFVAKEGVLTGLLHVATGAEASDGIAQGWGVLAFIVVILGSILTTAYSLRFLVGAFATKPKSVLKLTAGDNHKAKFHTVNGATSATLFLPPALLSLATVVVGIWPSGLDAIIAPYAKTLPGELTAHLLLWHGFEPALFISIGIIIAGTLLFFARVRVAQMQRAVHVEVDAVTAYSKAITGLNTIASATSQLVQRGGLQQYLATILMTFVAFSGTVLLLDGISPISIVPFDYPVQIPVAIGMGIAAIGAAITSYRIAAALLAGVTGYGMVIFFAYQGAPDLALTQALVETITIIVIVLVIRRLPARVPDSQPRYTKVLRAVLATAVAAVITVGAAVALTAREAATISAGFPELSQQAHGKNIVNVILVDIRAWDTMGEISVLVVVATGVASLLFVTGRTGGAPRKDELKRSRAERVRGVPVREPSVASPVTQSSASETPRRAWLMAGRSLSAANRSILLEVVVRFLFHPTIVVSIFLLFVGHNAPGGGFAGGLLAALAITARYLAAGRFELGEAIPIPAGYLLGAGIALAAGCAAVSLLFGAEPLTSAWLEWPIPLLGEISIGTTTIFDIGVYLVVVGLALDILRSLGAEVDRQEDDGLDSRPGESENALEGIR